MGKRLQNISLETRTLRVIRPSQTIEYVVQPSRFKNLTDEEYALLSPPPPLDPVVWDVQDTGSEPAPPPPPLPATTSTDDLPEGLINKYFTEARARQAAVSDALIDAVTNVAPSQNAVYDALATKVATASNVGTGTGNVFKQKTGTNLELRRLKQSTNVTIVQNGDDIEISASSTGEVNTGSNRGTSGVGKAEVFFQKTGVDLEFKRISAGTNITVAQDNDSITISSASGSGEANTASNRGTSGAGKAEVFFQKTGVDLEFKRLQEGSGVTITQDNDSVTVAAASQVQDSITDGETALAPSQNAVFDALVGKAAAVHTHVAADITDFTTAAQAAVALSLQSAYDGGDTIQIDTTGGNSLVLNQSTDSSELTEGSYALTIGNQGNVDLTLGTDATATLLNSWSNKPLKINSIGNDTLLNSGGGNVGIGVASTNARLDINANSGPIALKLVQAATSAGIDLTLSNASNSSGGINVVHQGSGGSAFTAQAASGIVFTAHGGVSGKIDIQVPTVITDYALTLPNNVSGSPDSFLFSQNGDGILQWANITAAQVSNFDTAAKAAAVADSLTDGVTDVAPSQNAVYDAIHGHQQFDAGGLADAVTVNYTGGPGAGILISHNGTGIGLNISQTGSGLGILAQAGNSYAASLSNNAAAFPTLALQNSNASGYALTMVGATSGAIRLGVPATVTDYAIVLPNAVGAAGSVLFDTSGNGLLSWVNLATAAKTAAVADAITNGVTDVAPSQNAVFDALALKHDAPLVATATITPTDMLTLSGTPVSVITAPGAGNAIAVERVEWFMDYGTTPYDSGNLLLQTATDNTLINSFDVTGDSVDTRQISTGFSYVPGVNQGVEVSIGVDATAGDSPIQVRVTYRTVSVLV